MNLIASKWTKARYIRLALWFQNSIDSKFETIDCNYEQNDYNNIMNEMITIMNEVITIIMNEVYSRKV